MYRGCVWHHFCQNWLKNDVKREKQKTVSPPFFPPFFHTSKGHFRDKTCIYTFILVYIALYKVVERGSVYFFFENTPAPQHTPYKMDQKKTPAKMDVSAVRWDSLVLPVSECVSHCQSHSKGRPTFRPHPFIRSLPLNSYLHHLLR